MEEVKEMVSELATQIKDDIRESNKQLLKEWNTQLKEELKIIREGLKQATDQLQEQNQEIRGKYEEWKRAKEEMRKKMGEAESQLDRMEREKRRNKVVMMELEIETEEQKQIIEKVTKFLEEKVKVERLRKKEKEFWDYVEKFDVMGLTETWVQRENWKKLEETLPQEYMSRGDKGQEKREKSGGILMGIRKEMQELEKGNNNKHGLMKNVIQLNNNRWEIITVYSKKMEETKINIEKETKDKANNKEGKILWEITEEMGWEILNGKKERDEEGE
ncbi:golgin subfamily A member 6-like protein 7 [Zophobas morio]|uniref:golgin subfamily A member 6-like protein 7 n=1 Tax=Zophobas morio TaxID=2755281 RepID=UPI0030828080